MGGSVNAKLGIDMRVYCLHNIVLSIPPIMCYTVRKGRRRQKCPLQFQSRWCALWGAWPAVYFHLYCRSLHWPGEKTRCHNLPELIHNKTKTAFSGGFIILTRSYSCRFEADWPCRSDNIWNSLFLGLFRWVAGDVPSQRILWYTFNNKIESCEEG